MKARRLVLVEWDDSISSQGTWTREEYVVAENADPEPIRSVGWLLKRTRRTTVIAAHICSHTGNVGGDMAIPNRAIRSIRDLREAGRKRR